MDRIIDRPRLRNKILENKAAKVLQAWLIALDYAALVSAKFEAEKDDLNLWEKGASIIGNSLVIENVLFKEMKATALEARHRNAAFKVALAFPKIYKIERGRRQFQPLFTIDISPIFEGNFQKRGWDLEQFEFHPVLPNLIALAEIDEEKAESLVTREGLHTFLEDTFKLSFNTLQDFLNLLALPEIPQTVQYVPYLLRFDFVPHDYNLKKDTKNILEQQQYWDWAHPDRPAYEYLFGRPAPPDHSVWYAGAFPTHPLTDSQAQIFKHLRCNSLTVVVGPPGCGKTTAFGHGFAMIVSDRALHLIETGRDESNLTLATGTSNRAIQNIEALLETDLAGSVPFPLYLPGGSKTGVIKERSLPQLQQAIIWLEETPFDEDQWQRLAASLRQKIDYLRTARTQDELAQLEKQKIACEMDEVKKQIASLEESLTALNPENSHVNPFDDYSEFPVQTYKHLQTCLRDNQSSNPSLVAEHSTPLNWLQRLYQSLVQFWGWLIKRRHRGFQSGFHERLAQLSTEIEESSFPIEFQIPLSDQQIKEKHTYVSAQIRAFQSWQMVDRLLSNLREQTERHSELEEQLARYPERDFYSRFYAAEFQSLQQEIFQLSRDYLRQEALRRKKEVRSSLELYAQILEGKDKDGLRYQKFHKQWRNVYRDLSLIFPVVTSTLHSLRNMFPFTDSDSLAYVFADETGATSIHQLFPALIRAKKALIVGDPLQLPPVISFDSQLLDQYHENAFINQGLTEEDFTRYSPTSYEITSAYQRASGADGQSDSKGYGITITDHFRCPEPVATLVDRLGNYGFSIKTTPVNPVLGSHLIATHINGTQQNEVNFQEIEAVEAWVAYLYSLGYSFGADNKKKTIAVISPYSKQANALRRTLQSHWHDCNEDNTNTVHSFQDGQRAIILFSTRQSHPADSLLFLNRGPNLINTAVSRVTESLILVGNLEKLKEGIYSRIMVDHIQQFGELRSDPISGLR
jgi:hypothetical protein